MDKKIFLQTYLESFSDEACWGGVHLRMNANARNHAEKISLHHLFDIFFSS
jgi:hypothetical protein